MMTENVPNYRGSAAPYGLGYVPGPWMQSIQVSKGSSSVKNGEVDKTDNVLVNAPHLEYEVVADTWEHSYTRQKAAYPIESVRENKFWRCV